MAWQAEYLRLGKVNEWLRTTSFLGFHTTLWALAHVMEALNSGISSWSGAEDSGNSMIDNSSGRKIGLKIPRSKGVNIADHLIALVWLLVLSLVLGESTCSST